MTEPRTILIVDDDTPFAERLARAMQKRGLVVHLALSLAEAGLILESVSPDLAVIDLRLKDGSGMGLVERLRGCAPAARIVILTGYGNIASAVAAVKAGAVDYLPKPADADEILAALTRELNEPLAVAGKPMSAERVRWEHIQRVLDDCGGNRSEAARRLNMHRRTLQRILAKRAPLS